MKHVCIGRAIVYRPETRNAYKTRKNWHPWILHVIKLQSTCKLISAKFLKFIVNKRITWWGRGGCCIFELFCIYRYGILFITFYLDRCSCPSEEHVQRWKVLQECGPVHPRKISKRRQVDRWGDATHGTVRLSPLWVWTAQLYRAALRREWDVHYHNKGIASETRNILLQSSSSSYFILFLHVYISTFKYTCTEYIYFYMLVYQVVR